MTDAPKRIWTDYFMANKLFLAFSDPPVNEFNDCRDEYILAAEHERLLSEARNKALEDAARMVDCACECRDAALAAKTKVERWNACGRDPCGALDAAAIRAMKD